MGASATRARRITNWVIGLAVLVAIGWWMSRPQPVAVDIGVVSRGHLQVTLDHEGKTRARHRYVVSAPVAGRVLRIALEPGDFVEAGRTELATLMPVAAPLLDARTRATADARVGTATAALAQARAALAQARTESAFADQEEGRMTRLFEAQAVSERDRAAAETEAQARRQAVEVADASVMVASRELEVARAALTAVADSAAGSPVTLRAPIDGVVLRRFRESEAVVASGEPLVELADVANLEVVADYLSTDAVKIRPGMRALIDRWGGERPLEGTVRLIEPSGFMKISALGVEEQRVNVVIDLDDPREAWQALGDGYRVEARVVRWEAADVLTVPASALFRQGDGWAVYAIDADETARLRAVVIGQQTGLEAEVVSGLSEGDRVVLHPSDRVAEGTLLASRYTPD
jgi:HlyD family secretion protein